MRAYLAVIASLALLTVVMVVPDVALIVIFVTVGFGFPLAFAATGLAYGLCAAPLAASLYQGVGARLVGAATSAILVAALALMPAYAGRWAAQRAAAARSAADHAPTAPLRASTLEIRRPADSWDGTFADRGCAAECRILLASGQAQWVRIVETRGSGPNASAEAAFHRALRGKACAVPGGAPPTEDAVCVVSAPDPGDPAELILDFQSPIERGNDAPAFSLASIVSERAAVARHRSAGQETEAMRRTEVKVMTPTLPALIGPVFQGWHSGGVDLVRETKTLGKLTLTDTLAQLGYSMAAPDAKILAQARAQADWRAPLDDDMTRQMIAVLDLPGDARFNGEQMAVLFTWIEHARNVTAWTPERVALLRRFVRDRRVRNPTFFDQIFERRPEVAEAILPDVLDMIEREGIGDDYTPARQAAYRFDTIDEALLRRYADRILALLDKGPDVRAILLPAIGRIGVDPSPYLTPILADRTAPSRYTFNPRAAGACRADAQWAKQLIAPLREAYRDSTGARGDDVAYRELLLRALTNLGDRDFVDNQIATSDRIDGKRLKQSIDAALSSKDPTSRLCRSF